MKFTDFLKQAKMSSADFDKHSFRYRDAVIDDLNNHKEVFFGNKTAGDIKVNGKKSIVIKNKLTKDQIEQLQNSISPAEFDAVLKGILNWPANVSIWTNIFKGNYSGYKEGLASNNKGNAFEQEFVRDFETKYKDQLVKHGIINKEFVLEKISLDGGANNKRPLNFTSNGIVIGNGVKNIGSTVTDVTLTGTTGEVVYLSLKYGSTVTFINAGVKTLFPISWFEGNSELPKDGKKLLDMFAIDAEQFKNIFNSYDKDKTTKSKAQKTVVDIKSKLIRSKEFKTFVRSVIGYGYTIVHKSAKGEVHYYPIENEQQVENNILGTIKSAAILYPTPGEAKRVDIMVSYKGIDFKFNIRSKDGGVYPTHIMADYILK